MRLQPIRYCAALFTLLLAPASLYSQTFGEITGHVTDSTGAAIADAAIRVTSASTNATRAVVTTSTGDFSVPLLPPGLYNITVERQGFKTERSSDIEVAVQQTVRLDFSLQIGQVYESVVVEANAVQLQSENATVGTVIDNKRIVELPLNGRNYLQLLALTPNVTTLSPPA